MYTNLITAVLVLSVTTPVLAKETFYVVHDDAMRGCTITTSEPSDKTRYEVLGKYESDAEAAKAAASMKQC
jgi:hypothetical protein